MESKIKIAFVFQFYRYYYKRIFELLSQRYDIDFFFFGGDMSIRRIPPDIRECWGKLGNFKGKYLKGFYLLPNLRITPTLIFKLFFGKYDIFIKCHNGRFALPVTFFIAKLLNRPFILWTEIWHHPETFFHKFSFYLMKKIYRDSHAICASGEAVKEYLLSLGIDQRKIFVAPPAVENSLYEKKPSEEEIEYIKNQLGIKDKKIILYVGRFVEFKGAVYLLEAFGNLNRRDTVLLLIGEGPQGRYLKGLVKQKGLKDVIFLGNIPNKFLYKYYALADIFVLPSIKTKSAVEGWGIVINEAMNQGLPIIATEDVGAVRGGLVKNGVNGLIVPPRDAKSLKEALEKLLSDENLRITLGNNSKEIIKNWTYDEMLEGFIKAIEYVKDNGYQRG
jgi:glycosyltransferase involved in cell wall biosynthesis